MRLLFAHDHRFYRGPGAELYTTGHLPRSVWARYLEHFDELHVIARDEGPLPAGVTLGRADLDGVEFEFLPSLSSLRQLILRSPELDEQMGAAVRSSDAVVARLPSEIGLLAVRHAQRQGKPYAVEVVGCAWDGAFNHGSFRARAYAPLAYLRNRCAIANAPYALYVTSSWLQQRYPTRGECASVSNVFLLPMTETDEKRRLARIAALARGKRPVLGTIASLKVKYKGIDTALEALARLRKSGLDLTYRVLGAGPAEAWRQLAERYGISDLVQFDGTRSAGEGVCSWLDEIDIHLQPSFTEALPRATVEAMSRGVACIGSTSGGIPELIPPERVHRPGDAAGLAEQIRRLAADPESLAAAVRRDRITAQEYDPEILKSRRSKFYGNLRRLAEERRVESRCAD